MSRAALQIALQPLFQVPAPASPALFMFSACHMRPSSPTLVMPSSLCLQRLHGPATTDAQRALQTRPHNMGAQRDLCSYVFFDCVAGNSGRQHVALADVAVFCCEELESCLTQQQQKDMSEKTCRVRGGAHYTCAHICGDYASSGYGWV